MITKVFLVNISLTNLSFTKKTFNFFLNKCSNYGYKDIEIAPYLTAKKPFAKKNIYKIKKLIKKKKINIVSLQSLFFGKITKNSDEENYKHFKKIFKFAQMLKIKKVSLGNAPFRKKNFLGETINVFLKISDIAKKYNIKVCIEPISKKYGNNFLTNHDQTLKFIKKLNRKNIKLLFDFGNFCEERNKNIELYFKKNIKFIDHVHLRGKDIKKIELINLKKKILFLKTIKYKKTLTIEYLNGRGNKIPKLKSLI